MLSIVRMIGHPRVVRFGGAPAMVVDSEPLKIMEALSKAHNNEYIKRLPASDIGKNILRF